MIYPLSENYRLDETYENHLIIKLASVSGDNLGYITLRYITC